MPVDAKESVRLMAEEGLVFFCAVCEHMHEALAGGRKTCGRENSCRSPMSGLGPSRTFPKYQGPVSDDFAREVCWVCGEPSEIGLHFVGSRKILGACTDHLDMHLVSGSGVQDVLVIQRTV